MAFGDGGVAAAGGVGVKILGSGARIENSGVIAGGSGGAGGDSALSNGGNGGSGGAGLVFTGSGSVFPNSGSVTRGNGGPAGTAPGLNGLPGPGGTGVVGSALTVVNSGTISGGLARDGITRADAIGFTGGTSISGTTGTLTGGITGALSIDPGTAAGGVVTLSNVIHDVTMAGSLTKIGAGTLVLSGNNTYSGGTTTSARCGFCVNQALRKQRTAFGRRVADSPSDHLQFTSNLLI